MINNLTQISDNVNSCNSKNFNTNITALLKLIKNITTSHTTTQHTTIIDYANLSKFLTDLQTKLNITNLLDIYKKDCEGYNLFVKKLIKICNKLKKKIINDYQLITLKHPIIGFYRSKQMFIKGYMEIQINTIEYLHKDLEKKEYNPGITFTKHNKDNKDNKDKKFLNFLDQICILEDTEFEKMARPTALKTNIRVTNNCNTTPATQLQSSEYTKSVNFKQHPLNALKTAPIDIYL